MPALLPVAGDAFLLRGSAKVCLDFPQGEHSSAACFARLRADEELVANDIPLQVNTGDFRRAYTAVEHQPQGESHGSVFGAFNSLFQPLHFFHCQGFDGLFRYAWVLHALHGVLIALFLYEYAVRYRPPLAVAAGAIGEHWA